ncbi:MAG TPA: type II secretion system major pseudopilin GspG [Bacillota bacterium]|nr:type II secretion system major pseudopilin GspG [Bacillota bacterium]
MKSRERGFTFLEILIVILIIGVLTAIVGPNLMRNIGSSKQVAAKDQIRILELALKQYFADTGQFPTTSQGLQALVKPPAPSPEGWAGPYLDKEVPKDPWGRDYVYLCPGRVNTESFDLFSLGSDGREGGTGEAADITNY